MGELETSATIVVALRGEYAADMQYVEAAAESLLGVLLPGELVVGKPTVPVGTASRLSEKVAGKVPGANLAWNPVVPA
jgi:UDPglucose 6-dehydrogenase